MSERLYAPEIADAILERLASGESLRAICRDKGMPNDRTVRGWVLDDRDCKDTDGNVHPRRGCS